MATDCMEKNLDFDTNELSQREASKLKRRRRILDEAHKVLAEQGYDALNSRDLAKAAGVTVPTLFRLIGNKEEIVTVLTLECIDQLEQRLNEIELTDALSNIEAIAIETVALHRADESFYRGSTVAMYRLSAQGIIGPEKYISGRCTEIATKACIQAEREGVLRGKISAKLLAEQMYSVFSTPWRSWTFNRISLDDFEKQTLRGFYLCLCGDASPAFLKILHKKINSL